MRIIITTTGKTAAMTARPMIFLLRLNFIMATRPYLGWESIGKATGPVKEIEWKNEQLFSGAARRAMAGRPAPQSRFSARRDF
jgi:hypothetical protein